MTVPQDHILYGARYDGKASRPAGEATVGTGETDEGYFNTDSKGVSLDTNSEYHTTPSRRGLPKGPGRGTFEKNSPMVTIYHQRATGDEPDITIFDVPRGHSRMLADMVGERFEPGSTVMTDEHPAYKSLRGGVRPPYGQPQRGRVCGRR